MSDRCWDKPCPDAFYPYGVPEGLMADEPVRSWTRLLASFSGESASSISTAANGSIYITVLTFGSLDGLTHSGGRDAFISKYRCDGTKAWTRLQGPITSLDASLKTIYDYEESISTAADGRLALMPCEFLPEV